MKSRGFQLRTRSLVGLLIAITSAIPANGQDHTFKDSVQTINPRQRVPFAIDDERVKAAGIRQIDGRHSTIYTDIRGRMEIDELATVFDLAVDQWCQYFSIEPEKTKHWKMRAYVMEDEARFRKAGLIPDDLPKFPAGYQLGRDMWVYVQPGPYYTRHLLLHEGTHAFMSWFLDGTGAPWFSEGMAEKLALNRWNTGKLELNVQVFNRNQVPYWGRVKLVRRDLLQGRGFSLAEVLQFPAQSFRDVNAYGWAWAACDFLANHPLSKKSFVEFFSQVDQPIQKFDFFVRNTLKPDWNQLELDWEIYVRDLEYGTDVNRIRLTPIQPDEQGPDQWVLKIDSQLGWQSAGCAVSTGDQIAIEARGRCRMGSSEINGKHEPWMATPNGISLQHHNGKRIGLLLAGVLTEDSDSPERKISGLLQPLEVGDSLTFTAAKTGLLVFRINDSSSSLDDNQGTLEVTIRKVK